MKQHQKIHSVVNSIFKDTQAGPPRLLLVTKKAKYANTDNHLEYLLSYLELLPNITQLFSEYHGCKSSETVKADIVTEADLNITSLVYTYINKHFKQDIIVDEESETVFPSNPQGVILFDPIDGTKEFAEGGNNCCHVFSRFAINNGWIEDGFSVIWEPYNNTLTIAVTVDENTSNLSATKQIETSPTQVNVGSHSLSHEERLTEVRHLLSPFEPIVFQILQSGSIELRNTLEGTCNIFIRRVQKIWDFLPGAFANVLAGHQVFFYDTDTNIFPLSLKQLTDIASLTPKSERKMKHLCITKINEQRQLIINRARQ